MNINKTLKIIAFLTIFSIVFPSFSAFGKNKTQEGMHTFLAYSVKYDKKEQFSSLFTSDIKLKPESVKNRALPVSTDDSVNSTPDFTDNFNLYTGPACGFYYEKGAVDSHFTGFKQYYNLRYYVRSGRLFDGYFDGCYYNDGLVDDNFNGIHKISGNEYCFSKGYLHTGLYNKIYYENGIKSNISGYIKIGAKRYYLDSGELACGIFDGAYFKDGKVDTSVNGKITIDGESYNFINGITSDGLHDGKWYTNGKFDRSVQGVKIYSKEPHYFKNGMLSTGVAYYNNGLRYFKDGFLKNYSGWLDAGGARYYFKNNFAISGVFKVGDLNYLFDSSGKLCRESESVFDNYVYLADENGVAYPAPQRYVSQLGSTIPYANDVNPNATVSSSGCGVCSALMIVLNETSNNLSLEEMTKMMLSSGCRTSSGSDMRAAAQLLEKNYGITCEITSDNEKLKEHLKKGYLAVANVGRVPLFSVSGGHYVVVSGMLNDDTAIILDPTATPTKYGSGIRKNIHFNSENNEVTASFDTLRQDAKNDCYYLFTPTRNIALRKSLSTYNMNQGNDMNLNYTKIQNTEKAIEAKNESKAEN